MTSLARLNVFGHRVIAISLGLLGGIFLSPLVSQLVLAQSSVQRDQKALTILQQSIAAGGGTQQLTDIQDFTETGTVTYYWDAQDTGNVTVKSRGLHQFRVDATLPEGTYSVVVNGASGAITDVNGWIWPIYSQSAADIGSMSFPCLPLAAATQNASTSIIYVGLVTHNGASLHDVRFQKVYTQQQDPSGSRGAREARDVYIDPSTYYVVAISDQLGVSSQGMPHEVLYSNYQSEGNVAMPLTITETVNGTTAVKMQLSQVAFNTGMGDSDFNN